MLPIQGLQIQSLLRELDPTCCLAKKKKKKNGWRQRSYFYTELPWKATIRRDLKRMKKLAMQVSEDKCSRQRKP